ncbi:hypothetical protein ACGE24_07645 [Corynebacterium kroppenstedtii]|uniref:hypothetical protein n=1 Tax=Corynebacterium sp. PCR 32 TaxID=3351342 RepID=UPI0030AEF637
MADYVDQVSDQLATHCPVDPAGQDTQLRDQLAAMTETRSNHADQEKTSWQHTEDDAATTALSAQDDQTIRRGYTL